MGYTPFTHFAGGQFIEREVWFTGTAAIEKGTAVCYNLDYGTATDKNPQSSVEVELPAAAGTPAKQKFAGVTVKAYPARPDGSAIGKIKIYVPGSLAYVKVATNVTQGDYLTYNRSATATVSGFYVYAPARVGLGTAQIIQTNASAVTYADLTGTGSVSTTTLTDAGNLGTAVTTGDTCRIFGGSNGTTAVTQGSYVCTQAAGTDTTTLASAPGDGNIAYSIVPATPNVVLAYLVEEGLEDDGCSFVSPINGASQANVGGNTLVCGTITPGGDATSTLADGTKVGQFIGYKLLGALTTNDYLCTVTSGIQADGSTALATFEMDAANDEIYLEWIGSEWMLRLNKGPTLA